MKTLIAICKNTTADTFHPIIYVESSLPGSIADQPVTRLKSSMHHTSGFATLEAAVENIDTQLHKMIVDSYGGTPEVIKDVVFEWDGKEIPTDTVFR